MKQLQSLIILFGGLFFSSLLLSLVDGVYTGPRYGKRDSSSESIGKNGIQRSSRVRSIQARSTGERRFYPGTRFGGKRAIWQSVPVLVGTDNELAPSSSNTNSGSQFLPLSSIPYECAYIPFIGVRCMKPLDSNNDPEESLISSNYGGSNIGNGIVNENGINQAVTGIDP